MTVKDSLSRLTLVVPTYDRQDFALRCMNYWADKGPHLIVLDGSAKPIEPAKLDIFGSHIHYLHRPVGMYQRLFESLSLIQTKYVALAGDDEFYIPTVVAACIKELDQDDGLVACCGRALGFRPENQRLLGRAQYPRLERYGIDADSAEERVVQHMRDYVPSLVYAICSATQWKIAWKYILQKEFPFFAAAELQFEMCMAYAGRSKVIPQLMWLRSHGETERVRGTDSWLDEKQKFPAWWADSSKAKEHEEFVYLISRGFSELRPDAGVDLRDAAVGGIEAYLVFAENRQRGHIGLRLLKRGAVKMIPDYAKPLLKNLLARAFGSKSGYDTELLQAARFLEESGVSVDFSSLEGIQKIIIQFHKNRNSVGF